MGVKWLDTNEGDKEQPEYRCRLVAKETKRDKRFFARGDAAAGGEEDVVLALGQCGRDALELRRCSSCLLSREGEEKSLCVAVNRGL